MSGISFIGDVMLGRGVALQTSPEELQRAVQQLVGDHQLVANLECCITDEDTPGAHAHSAFTGSRELLVALKDAGLVAACVANNHSLDFGEKGFTDTIDALQHLGIQPLGFKNPEITSFDYRIEQRHLRVFSACALTLPAIFRKAGVLEPNDSDLHNAIQESVRAGEDAIVYIHWGHEGITVPPPEARALAQSFAELGVRLVVGHGPHVVQGIEQLGACTVYYSLGDSIFDRADIANRSWSLKVDVDVVEGKLAVQHTPFAIDPTTFTPSLASDPQHQALVDERSRVLTDKKLYDRMFAKQAGGGFVGQQIRSTLRLVKRSGVRGLTTKIGGLRMRHLRLLGLSMRQLVKRS